MPAMDCRVGLRPPRNDERGLGASLLSMHQNKSRHCEEQRDEAIYLSMRSRPGMDCHVGLCPPRNDERGLGASLLSMHQNKSRHCEE